MNSLTQDELEMSQRWGWSLTSTVITAALDHREPHSRTVLFQMQNLFKVIITLLLLLKWRRFLKNICLFCTWARILWYSSRCTQSLDGHRLHTQGLILQKQLLGELMKGHAHLSTGGKEDSSSPGLFYLILGKTSRILTLVTVAVLINSNDFFLCLLR